jgi:hypothetical protein
MKILKAAAISCFLILISTGCILQSLHPFCANEDAIDVPQFNGKWKLAKLFEKSDGLEKINDWEIGGGKMITYDEKNVSSTLEIKFFKAGDSYFADISPAPLEENNASVNQYWLWCVLPVHTLAKFAISDDVLRIIPADYKVISEKLKNGEIKLEYIRHEEGDTALLSAKTEDLKKFVLSIKDDLEIFNPEKSFVLKKSKP